MSASLPISASADVQTFPSPRPWYRPGIADVIFLFVALLVMRGASQGLLDDPGLGWHLRNIDAMIEQGGWLTTDPFTDPRVHPPGPWYTNQWLGELPLWLGWRLAGLEGIAVATALVVALMARCLYVLLLRDGLPWPAAVAWTTLGAFATSCSWNARPNVFTILFVLLTAYVCERFSSGRLSRAKTWWLVPIFLVWANIHGGFVAGLIILVAATLGTLASAIGSLTPEGKAEARSRCLHLALLTTACLLATLINPYGPGLYRWVFRLLGADYFMKLHQEWKSPDFNSAGAMRYEILLLLFPFVLGLSSRRPGLVELGLAVLWLHLALTGFRYVALWAVVAVPVMARSSMEIPYLQELARRGELSAGQGSLFATRPDAGPWVVSLLFAIVLVAGAVVMKGHLARHGDNIIATRALDRFLEIQQQWRDKHGCRPVIFHSYDWGGYLTWHGWPEVLNWIDDRNEAQGVEHAKKYFQIRDAEPGWEEKLEKVDLVCIESEAPLAHRLAERPEVWQKDEGYQGKDAVIFERRR
jgi:hypothetical protein